MSENLKDKKIQELLKLVTIQKEKISKTENHRWVTNCTFGYTEDSSNRINLVAVGDSKTIVNMLAFLLGKERDFLLARNILGVTVEFTWGGYTIEEWQTDFAAKIAKININAERKKLELLEIRLNALVSPELRAELELAEIEKLLN